MTGKGAGAGAVAVPPLRARAAGILPARAAYTWRMIQMGLDQAQWPYTCSTRR